MKYSSYALQIILIFNLGLLSAQESSWPEKPNIICILVDDLGFGDLSVMGATDMQTPNIDLLATNGMQLNNFYANSTVCSPSRAALLTGRYPDAVGVPGVIRQTKENNWGNLSDDAVLISKVLAENGYHTGMVGKWHLGLERPDTPNDRGFTEFKGFLGDMMDDYYTHLRRGVNWMRHNRKEVHPTGHATDIFTDWAIEYLEDRESDKAPFFLYLAYNAPHFPIQPPENWLAKVKQREQGISEKRAKNVALIEHLDDNIGKLLEKLEGSGLDEHTLIVFTSDNGGSLAHAQSNGELRGGKQDMYEGGIKVPAFFYFKDIIAPGSESDNIGILMDLFPTFLEMAGADYSGEIDGLSLLPTLKGQSQDTSDRDLFWVRREGGDYGGQAYYAARNGNLKILQNTPFDPMEYFDMVKNPLENPDVDAISKEDTSKLRYALMQHIRECGNIPWQ